MGDFNFEFGSDSCQFFDIIDTWNISTIDGQPAVESGVPKLQHTGTEKSSCTLLSHFRSPASAFLATERCMGLPLCESQFSETNDSHQFPMYRSFRDSPCKEIARLVEPDFEMRNTLQAMVRPPLNYRSSQKSNTTTLGILRGNNFFPPAQLDSFGENSNSMGRHLSIPSGRNQDHIVVSSSYGSSIISTNSSPSSPMFPSLSSSTASAATPTLSKARIRWTQDLHQKFVECVDRLGGSEKATPKAILKLMESDGLTIFQVKSHLQKCRIAKHKPESAEGKVGKRAILNNVKVDLKTGFQLKEALQLQLDVQRRLHEQLEIQRNLQLRIEEQGRQLKMMFNQQQKTGHSICETSKPDITPDS